jgi:hypothetical protein
VPCLSHFSRLYHPYNIGWGVQIIHLLIICTLHLTITKRRESYTRHEANRLNKITNLWTSSLWAERTKSWLYGTNYLGSREATCRTFSFSWVSPRIDC